MVEVIKNTVSRMEPRKPSGSANASANHTRVSETSAPGSDSVTLKSTDNQSTVKQMAASAPINEMNVNRIKEAIKRGDYPIDIDRVSEALMEAYRDMKT